MPQFIAVVPARKGSKGIPNKNPLLFDRTIDFIESLGFFDEIVVTTNDEQVAAMAARRKCRVHIRPDETAVSTAPIKPAFETMTSALGLPADAYLWLFYIPFVFRDAADFHAAKAIIDQQRPSSISTFVPAATHPFRCWGQDKVTGKMFKFCDSEKVSRQDFPDAWANHHYIYCIRADALDSVNGNLLGPDTTPIYYTSAQAERLIELDEMSDVQEWAHRYPEDYAVWWHALPADQRIGPSPE
ncbi:MAG: N-acylneuraminate [Rhodospirillaceae bacterium]|nr:MAG: N-acylneuraminate [Rhodospirillaceae bacterium]TNC97438.1 MAG: N-acylneuraminate cytidylyltransferase [Stygiobacter sp.]